MSKEKCINLYPLKTHYIVTDILGHKTFNKKLLKIINSMPKHGIRNTKDSYVSNTDWETPIENKPYLEYFFTKIKPYYDCIAKRLCPVGWKWTSGKTWFQQYEKGSNHNWHNHEECTHTNVYFVQLPSNNYCTEFYDFITGKSIKAKVKEGQLLTLGSSIMHRSPSNNSNKLKTVISFNTNVKSYRL